MVGEEIAKRGSNLVVGVDILSEAKEATERDRAGIYDKYYVMDLDDPDDKDMEKLEQYDFNTLISVAALGFDDIPPRAFLNAFNLIKDGGWVAFNIKDRFLTNKDDTGYKDIITGIRDSNMTILCEKRYCHRLSLSGEELYYIAIIGRKMADVNLSEVDI
jgi:SAM-dependent methyltransferase